MGIISNTRLRPGSPQNERFARLSVVVGDSQDFFLHQTRRTLAQLGVRDMHLARDGAAPSHHRLGPEGHSGV